MALPREVGANILHLRDEGDTLVGIYRVFFEFRIDLNRLRIGRLPVAFFIVAIVYGEAFSVSDDNLVQFPLFMGMHSAASFLKGIKKRSAILSLLKV
jgi:hypothetical protein